MNKQGPNGIEWCHFSWSPLTGCLHGCSYCYARRIAERFKGTKAFPNGFAPTWRPERLQEPLKLGKPSRIFACSMSDPFGGWVSWAQTALLFAAMQRANWHKFLLLTKQPQNIVQHLEELSHFPLNNVWLGCTLTGVEGEQDPSSSMCELQDIGWHVFVCATNPRCHC